MKKVIFFLLLCSVSADSSPFYLGSIRSALNASSTSIIEGVGAGDSSAMGAYADGLSANWTNGFVGRIRSNLQAVYGNAGTGFAPAVNGNPSTLNTINCVGSGWIEDANFRIPFGGSLVKSNISSGNGFAYVQGPWIMIDILYGENSDTDSGANKVVMYVNGVGEVDSFTTSYSVTPVIRRRRITFNNSDSHPGFHDAVLTPEASTPFHFIGCVFYSATNGFILSEIAQSAQGISNYVGTKIFSEVEAQAQINRFYAALNPSLYIHALSLNDFVFQTPLSNYTNQTAIALNAMPSTCSQIVVGMTARDPKSYAIPQSAYNEALECLARDRGVGFIDLLKYFGSFSSIQSYGMLHDSVHPNTFGHNEIAKAIMTYAFPEAKLNIVGTMLKKYLNLSAEDTALVDTILQQ